MDDVLYVGSDDSNHGSKNGEFIVAIFSFVHDDSLVRRFPNRRNILEVEKWIKDFDRDYRFAICTGDDYNSSLNIPRVLPSLIKSFINEVDWNGKVIKAYLDGRLDEWAKRKMRGELSSISGIEKVVINNFIKKRTIKGKTIKGYYCPKLVWAADTLANHLYKSSKNVSYLPQHEKMIIL